MYTRTLALLLILASALPTVSLPITATQRNARTAINPSPNHIPAPEDVLGFRPGDDRKLASWNQVLQYFDQLAKASNRVKFEALSKSTMDLPFVMATISAPENLARLDEYRRIQELLADPRKLGPLGLRERKAADLIARGKTIVLITCGIHSTEVGSYLSSMLIAYRLASSDEPEIQDILKNTIILLVPSLNPDGVDIVKNWYDKTLGTPYEGTDPPQLYHKYTGHDNNRDWYAFTQVETKIAVDKIHNVWHPQIVHDIHQQGAYGSRLFLPPYTEPVEPNVPRQIVQGYTELGNWMASQMRAAGFKGLTTNSTYDAWSPSRSYSHYHGGVRILSETASCKLATPIKVTFAELRSRDGYDPQKESANFGPVWRGGEWRLQDITNYMTTAAFLLMEHAAQNRERWLRRFYEIGKEAVRPRKKGELFAFLIGPSHRLADTFENMELLLDILRQGSVEETYTERGVIVRMAQPYGGFAKALLEVQHYPDHRDSTGRPVQPYDVTAHTLPLLMEIEASPVFALFKYTKIRHGRGDGGCSKRVDRIGIYKSHVPSIDEGWTRWVAGSPEYCLDPSSLEDGEARRGDLQMRYESIIIPDQPPRTIFNGFRAGTMPPEYTGGLGAEGVKALRDFVEQGGTLVCLNRASDFAIEQFKLPIRDITEGLSLKQFYVPGSILRIELDTSHPVAQGMPKESIAWAEDSPVFEVISGTGVPPVPKRTIGTGSNTGGTPVPQVRIIARYPTDKNPLLSGWLVGGDRIKGKAALVEVTVGKGRVILFGFRPQYRGQSLATYPLFFNAIKGN